MNAAPLYFSIIIPVYNRPDEIEELLDSLVRQDFNEDYEIVIVEDGSTYTAEGIIETYDKLPITYLKKENTGPGPSRNYGMSRAKGDYFIILDSDCILPSNYLSNVKNGLQRRFTDFFGGPDDAHRSFTDVQKAINFSMTSFLTTGGIRGRADSSSFQPRSFNMGISKVAFEASGGFGKIHPGEDPDLTLRLWKQGYESQLITSAVVYHKRRISWQSFYAQVRKFGLVRPILNVWHPESSKLTYWFPTLFLIYLIMSLVLLGFKIWLPILFLLIYLITIGVGAALRYENPVVGIMSIWSTLIQFLGYGWGFLQSTIQVGLLKNEPQRQYPHLFFE